MNISVSLIHFLTVSSSNYGYFKLVEFFNLYVVIGHRHRRAEEQTCDLCTMKFSTVYNLKRHLLTHTGEKRKNNISYFIFNCVNKVAINHCKNRFSAFKCQYCERAFAQGGDLNKHLRLHVGENTYKCELCDKRFRLQMDLRKHSYEHFQNETKGEPIEPLDANVLS